MKKILLLTAGFACLTLDAIVVENAANAQIRGESFHVIPDFEVVNGSHRKLVFSVTAEMGRGAVATVSQGTQSLTRAVSTQSVDPTTGRFAEIWYLDDPDVGTNDIVLNLFGSSGELLTWRSYIGAVSLTGAAPGGPTASLAEVGFGDPDPTTATVEFAPADPHSLIFGAYTTQFTFLDHPSVPDQMTELYRGDSGSSNASAGYVVLPGTDPTTWTWDSGPAEIPLRAGVPDNGVVMAAFSPIPEPASALWLGIGGLLVAIGARRTRLKGLLVLIRNRT